MPDESFLSASTWQPADRATSAIVAPPPMPVRETGPERPYTEGLPKFLQHYRTRWDASSLTDGSSDAHILGACRSLSDERDADVCDVLGLLDVWPPALVTIMKSFSAGSTASWTVDFVSNTVQGLTSGWWSYEVRAVAASGGYGQTQAWLWDPEGRAVARSTQLVAVFE